MVTGRYASKIAVVSDRWSGCVTTAVGVRRFVSHAVVRDGEIWVKFQNFRKGSVDKIPV